MYGLVLRVLWRHDSVPPGMQIAPRATIRRLMGNIESSIHPLRCPGKLHLKEDQIPSFRLLHFCWDTARGQRFKVLAEKFSGCLSATRAVDKIARGAIICILEIEAVSVAHWCNSN